MHDDIMTSLPGAVHPEWLKAIEQHYNVLGIFILHLYDQNFELLQQRLTQIKKTEFDSQDRIIIVHFDSDYYIQNQFGVDLYNLFTIWQHMDLPWHTMMIYTNHVGIGREVDQLCQYADPADQPTIIETFLNGLSFDQQAYDTEPDLNVDQIQYHGLALMSHPRSHRYALYNHIKHLGAKLAITIRAPK